jgi:NifB/MoaA-like Fe-S oxidoreductase
VDIIAQMKHFIENGIEIHAQVVLCPTINDGQHLVKTIYDLAELSPGIVSTAIVPLGITDKHKYRNRLVAVTDEFCAETIDLVTPIQNELKKRLGTVFAFLGDEFYIRAGRPIPPKSHYRIVRGSEGYDYPQIEDGVGMVERFCQWIEKSPALIVGVDGIIQTTEAHRGIPLGSEEQSACAQLRCVTADILPDNVAMKRVCEKLGIHLQYSLAERLVKAAIAL